MSTVIPGPRQWGVDRLSVCAILAGYAEYGTYIGWDQFVYAGGVTYYASALTGAGDQYVSGGAAYYTYVSGGGGQIRLPGGSAYESTISSGGFQYVESGGTANNSYVYRGGVPDMYYRRDRQLRLYVYRWRPIRLERRLRLRH